MAVFHHGMTVSVIAGKPQKYIEAWSLLPLLELTGDCGAIGHGERMLELVREVQDPFAVCSRDRKGA